MITLDEWTIWDSRQIALRKLDKKVFAMLCVDWAYSVLPIFEERYPEDKRPRQAIEAAESYTNNIYSSNNFDKNFLYLFTETNDDAAIFAGKAAIRTAYAAVHYNVIHAAYIVTYVESAKGGYGSWWSLRRIASWARRPPWEYTYKTYLHALGPNNKTFNPNWITSTVLAVAKSKDYSILADALEDAGCTNTEILEHLRKNEDWTRADWVLRQLYQGGHDGN